jgi:hypothetical protein
LRKGQDLDAISRVVDLVLDLSNSPAIVGINSDEESENEGEGDVVRRINSDEENENEGENDVVRRINAEEEEGEGTVVRRRGLPPNWSDLGDRKLWLKISINYILVSLDSDHEGEFDFISQANSGIETAMRPRNNPNGMFVRDGSR